ncbi:DUF6292 family protein [Planotetraspora kaengkrachanensis]|uniref:DUF6292 domain-containing protein n=1 Tax=Planotetraspora kaengkrachanensis TaxID=575193 RepID=A0A8J3PT37_9ACTN|nr:DUF6292 family protein [Planotetraspora kaengkrachanensis]GIG80299.1 hypothetical protein Pka01_34260 [Planotetraspora kaengkrachanensis]
MTLRPEPYSEAWLRLPLPYVRQVADVLGDRVASWWDDPFDPRDATIRLTDGTALVWDEESGWRHGGFGSGRQGVRTVLGGVRHLGGGVLPEPARVVALLDDPAYGGATRPVYRSYTDVHDGFDAALAGYAPVLR